MKYAARTATLILVGFLAMASTCERAAGQHGVMQEAAARGGERSGACGFGRVGRSSSRSAWTLVHPLPPVIFPSAGPPWAVPRTHAFVVP